MDNENENDKLSDSDLSDTSRFTELSIKQTNYKSNYSYLRKKRNGQRAYTYSLDNEQDNLEDSKNSKNTNSNGFDLPTFFIDDTEK